MAKRKRLGQKQCPKCSKWIKGPRTKTCPHCGHQFQSRPVEAPVAQPAATAVMDKPVKSGDVITIEQIKRVGQMVQAIGGFGRLNELVGVIREVGGLKRFKDLLEAMSVTGQGETKV
jgi:hypothetical protein